MNKLIFSIIITLTTLAGTGYYVFTSIQNGQGLQSTLINAKNKILTTPEIINTVQNQWQAGQNFAPDFNVKMLLGVKKNLGATFQKTYKNITVAASIPATFDSRTAWPNCQSIKEIRNQANCGSCWAFGAVEAMSDRICIHSGQVDQTRISADNLMSCCSSCGNGCNGGDLAPSWQYWVDTGLVTGDVYGTKDVCQPYPFNCIYDNGQGNVSPNMCPANSEANTPACTSSCQSGYTTSYNNDLHFGASAYSISSDVSQIQTEIMTNGPVEAAFDVYEDFTLYKSGVYNHVSGTYLGGHAIKILGWGTLNNVDYWLVANSWTTTWGQEGFFMIQRGTDECGIEDDVNAGMPKY